VAPLLAAYREAQQRLADITNALRQVPLSSLPANWDAKRDYTPAPELAKDWHRAIEALKTDSQALLPGQDSPMKRKRLEDTPDEIAA
jgi:hypothetical protein